MPKLILPADSGCNNVYDTSDILYIKASSNYSEIILSNKSKVVVSKTLGRFIEILESAGFVRISKSYIVNSSHITKITEGFVFLNSGDSIHYTSTKQELISKLQFLTI